MVATKVADLKPNPSRIDPNVKIPAAVQRAADAAEAAQKAAYPDSAPKAPDAPAQIDPNNISIAPPEAPATPPTPPTLVEPPKPPQQQPQVTPPGNDEKQWPAEVQLEFHKIRSAEGRKRAQLEQQLQQAVDRMGALELMIQDLKAAPPVVAAPTPSFAKLITAEEEEQIGSEMLDVMARRAKEIVAPEVAELRAEIARLTGTVQGTQLETKKTARQAMHAKLSEAVPNWQEINNLTEFKAWLALPDPYSGVTRHGMLLSAYEQNDTPRVLNFFKGFVSELAATTPVEEPQLPAPAAVIQQPPKPGLENLAAPGRARTPAQVNAPAEKQIITTADVAEFYAAKRRGDYKGREAEFDAAERELFQAQREGRVRQV